MFILIHCRFSIMDCSLSNHFVQAYGMSRVATGAARIKVPVVGGNRSSLFLSIESDLVVRHAALELGADLGAEQQDQGGEFETQQDNDGRCQRPVDQIHQQQTGEVPDENMPYDFPEDGGGDSADQRMMEGDSSHRHDEIERGHQ